MRYVGHFGIALNMAIESLVVWSVVIGAAEKFVPYFVTGAW